MNTGIKKTLAVLLSVVMILSGAFASMAATLSAAPVKNGWYQVIDKLSGQENWYYYENGNRKTGWLTDSQDGNTYYLDPETGAMCVGWKKIGDNWYYFGERKYADIRWTRDAAGNWKAGTGRHSYGSMYHDEMTPDGYYVGAGGIWKKSSASSGSSSGSGGGSLGTRVKAETETAQYPGKAFNPNGLVFTIYKGGRVFKTIRYPDNSITIRKTMVNGQENGLLRTGSNIIMISFVYCDGDVLIGQSLTTTLTVRTSLDYSSPDNWYQTGYDYDPNKIDVFYILWTVIFNATDEYGIPILNSSLSAEERAIFDGAFAFSQEIMFDSQTFNFIAPYYRQLTMTSFSTPGLMFLSSTATASRDICDAFDYYMEHQNNGRPFIIAGFSQGGLMTKVLLKHMTDEQYSRMIAAYSMGFQVTPDELTDPHINAAQGEDDLGVIISYNSVASTKAIWSQVAGDSGACINPVNWSTGIEETELVTEFGDTAKIHVDQNRQVLIIEGLDNEKYGGQNYDGTVYPMPKGNYHMWEMRFYADKIRDNAIHRAELFNAGS